MLNQDQFGTIQNLQTSPILQTSFLVGTFFAVSYSKTALERIFTFIFDEAILRNFKGYHFCQFLINYFFHFVQAFLFFSVSTKDCKRMQRYESRCPWLYSRLTRWLNALEKRLFPPPLLLKINKPQKIFFYFNFSKKNELH